MLVIGLTGGIGSGKSTVGKLLVALGAAHIDADRVGHSVYAPGTPGWELVTQEFGREIVGPDGAIDRKRLGAIVFADPKALARLNQIVHPLIRSALQAQIAELRERAGVPAIVVEAAILVEAGWHQTVDQVWLVSVTPETITARLQRDRGMSVAEIEARMRAQLPDEERRRHAHVVLSNDGTLAELEATVRAAWAKAVGPLPPV